MFFFLENLSKPNFKSIVDTWINKLCWIIPVLVNNCAARTVSWLDQAVTFDCCLGVLGRGKILFCYKLISWCRCDEIQKQINIKCIRMCMARVIRTVLVIIIFPLFIAIISYHTDNYHNDSQGIVCLSPASFVKAPFFWFVVVLFFMQPPKPQKEIKRRRTAGTGAVGPCSRAHTRPPPTPHYRWSYVLQPLLFRHRRPAHRAQIPPSNSKHNENKRMKYFTPT